MKFWIHCNPPKSTGQAGLRIIRKSDGTQFVGKFEKSKSKQAQRELMALLMPHRPSQPLEGPLRLSVMWRYPWRKSEPKKNMVTGIRWCDKKPDADNLCKMLQDNMTRLGFWNDDSQVAHLAIKKQWGDRIGIGIEIEHLPMLADSDETETEQETML